MISISLRPANRRWSTISFASTLYLRPVLDLLLSEVPEVCRPELMLGLQEALVNAAKHGNNLDPTKTVHVQFSAASNQCCWIISDQGKGFAPPESCQPSMTESNCHCEQESGRGLYLLYQIFDQVHWNAAGTELKLSKRFNNNRGKRFLLA